MSGGVRMQIAEDDSGGLPAIRAAALSSRGGIEHACRL
jgi:hypothetical protein